MKIPILNGEKVTLRPIDIKKDSLEWYEIMKDKQMHLWTGNTVPRDISETESLLQIYKSYEDLLAWTIVENKGNKMIGTYWIKVPYEENNKKIISDEAQRIGREYWRKGYTKEARKLVYNYAFFVLDVDEIYAQAWSDNINSCKSMESAGFRLHRAYEKLFPKYNKSFVQHEYVLSKKNWEKNIRIK